MAQVKYTVVDQLPENIPEVEKYSAKDISLINNFIINKKFNYNTHYIESHFYTPNNVRLLSLYDYTLPNKEVLAKSENFDEEDETAIEDLLEQITLDPATLADAYGYVNTDVKVLFHFLNDSFTFDNTKHKFFIKSISEDRTEIALFSNTISFSRLRSTVEDLKDKLLNESYFDELWLNFGDNDLFIVTNIDTFKVDNLNTVTVKLYEPLPERYGIDSTLQVVEKISDSVAVRVIPEFIEEQKSAPFLQGPNFSVEVNDSRGEPTDFQDFNTLFNFDNVNRNREIYTYIKKSDINLGIDYNDYSNFINFSSAVERLKNFKYKIELIDTYQSDLNTELGLNNSSTTNISGSIEANKASIKGIIENFDHYERHLYYESGSTSWPKLPAGTLHQGEILNGKKPYTNYKPTHDVATTWYQGQLISASNYDNSNYDAISNFLPDYISEDTNNAPAILFTHMLGQHYDNLWIYSKAIADKYDTDHRLTRGISKDLVKDAVRSMGVKIYSSIEGSNNLFKYLINDQYDSGSAAEVINTFTSASSNQPISRIDYEGELFKRIYHNIPFLLKNKGTQRGIRALISCFGIPDDIIVDSGFLKVSQFGKVPSVTQNASAHDLGPESKTSSSRDRIITHSQPQTSVDNKTLSLYTSTLDTNSLTGSILSSSASPVVEIGFSPSEIVDKTMLDNLTHESYTGESNYKSAYKLDSFLGDPSNLNKDIYKNSTPGTHQDNGTFTVLDTLKKLAEELAHVATGGTQVSPTNLKDFVRIFKFHDNILYKMIHDFIPERSKLSSGIIIKPLVFNRSKIKSPILTGTDDTYSGSIDTAFVTGSSGGGFNLKDNSVFIDLEHRELPAPWYGEVGGATDIIFQFNNQGINSIRSRFEVGEIGVGGNEYFHPDGTHYILEDRSGNTLPQEDSMFTPFEGGNNHNHFHIMFTSESVQQRFSSLTNSSDIHPHFVPIRHLGGRVETISQPTGANTGSSYAVTNDVDTSNTGGGQGLKINITAINSDDGVTQVSISKSGTGYAVGDEITLINEGDQNCKFTVTGITEYYEVQGNSIDETIPLTGSIIRYNDVILSTVHQSGSGLATPIHNYYTSLSGNRVFTTGSYTSVYYNRVKTAVLTNAGQGGTKGLYQTVSVAPGAGINPMSGSGLTVNVTSVDGGGRITGFEIVDRGQGYIVNGVTTANVTAPGTNYSNAPQTYNTSYVTSTGVGREFRVKNLVVNGSAGVTDFTIENPGFGYQQGEVVKIVSGSNDAQLIVNQLSSTTVHLVGFSPSGQPSASLRIDEVEGIPKPSSNQGHLNPPTFYKEVIKTKSGSVDKQISDDSPIFDGELSGTNLVVTDGELNENNIFKIDKPNEILYDITRIAQDGADVLTAFIIFNNGSSANSNSAACQLGGTGVTRYHSSNLTHPDMANTGAFYDPNGDGTNRPVVSTQPDGNGVVNGGSNWYKAIFSDPVGQSSVGPFAIQINNSGEIIDIDGCGQFDTTAPDAFNYAWTVSSINATNVTAASFELHGLNETVTLQYTASSTGGGSPLVATQTLTFPPDGVAGSQAQLTQSVTFDATNVADGTVTLHVSASDAAGNVTNGTDGIFGNASTYFGKTINKNVVAPSGYTGFIAHETGLNTFATASIIVSSNDIFDANINFKVDVPSGFTGSVTVTATGNNSTVTKTIAHPPAGNVVSAGDISTPTITNFDGSGNVFKRSGNYTNFVTATVTLTDTAGNSGPAVNVGNSGNGVTHRDYFYQWWQDPANSPQTTTYVAASSDTSVNLRYKTRFFISDGDLEAAYGEDPAVDWMSGHAESFSGYSSATRLRDVQVPISANSTEYQRDTYLTGSITVDNQEITLPSLLIAQSGDCVDPDTKILTPEGYTLAGELKVGDVVRTKGEFLTKEWVQDIVIQVRVSYASKRIKLYFDDGEILIASPGHRIFIESEDKYVALKNLNKGDKSTGKKIDKIEHLDGGNIVRITTEKAHTYISNGVLSHNAKAATQ